MAHAMQVPGRIGSHYQLLSPLGVGGMGAVYKAFDSQLERTVALKFVAHSDCGNEERARVLREARAASQLDHANIATVHSVEETDDGQLFIVMAYCEGESLSSRMQRGPIKRSESVKILADIAAGLEHAHAHAVVHRDIKPSNIILSNSNVAKIVDFGLARLVTSDTVTQSANPAGTLSYMSPEQIAGRAVDARSDIWSLGVIAFELLTGQFPFAHDTPMATVAGILNADPDLSPLPPMLRLIVGKALSKDITQRYQSCTELLKDLRSFQATANDDNVLAPERTRTPLVYRLSQWLKLRVGSWRKRAVVLSIGLVVLTVFGFWGWQRHANRTVTLKTRPASYEIYQRGMEALYRYDKPGNIDVSISRFQESLKTDPKFALASAALGDAYWIKYRLDENTQWIDLATQAAQRAAQLNDQLPAVYITLGRIHGGTGQHDLAIQELHRALELDPRNADALLGLGDVYGTLGRSAEAEESYRRAIAMRPDNWVGVYRLGSFYYAQRRYAEAADQFREVLRLIPDHGLAHASLGVSALALGNAGEAERELRIAIAIAPDYAAYTNLGLLYFNKKRFADAADMMQHALALNDNDYRQWHDVAQTFEWLGKQDKAADAYRRERILLEKGAQIKPDDAIVQSQLGLSYARQHLRDKALPHLEASLALVPNDPDILSNLGEAYELLGERSQAIHYLGKALSSGYDAGTLQLNPSLRFLLSDSATRRALNLPSQEH